jgi:hypothetical protein
MDNARRVAGWSAIVAAALYLLPPVIVALNGLAGAEEQDFLLASPVRSIWWSGAVQALLMIGIGVAFLALVTGAGAILWERMTSVWQQVAHTMGLLRAARPATRVVVVTIYDDDGSVRPGCRCERLCRQGRVGRRGRRRGAGGRNGREPARLGNRGPPGGGIIRTAGATGRVRVRPARRHGPGPGDRDDSSPGPLIRFGLA